MINQSSVGLEQRKVQKHKHFIISSTKMSWSGVQTVRKMIMSKTSVMVREWNDEENVCSYALDP